MSKSILSQLKFKPAKIPRKEVIDRRLDYVLQIMEIPAEFVQEIRSSTYERKWQFLQESEPKLPRHSPSAFIAQLERLTNGKNPFKKSRSSDMDAEQCLKGLETALRASNPAWFAEFLRHNGIEHLVRYMQRLFALFKQRKEQFDLISGTGKSNSLESPMRSARDITPSQRRVRSLRSETSVAFGSTMFPLSSKLDLMRMTDRAQTKLDDVTTQIELLQNTIHNCLMCLRAIMNQRIGLAEVLSHSAAIVYVAMCLQSRLPRTRVAVLELLTALCFVSAHERVLQAFTSMKQEVGERARFESIVKMLTESSHEPECSRAEKEESRIWCMQFINVVVHNTDNINERAALQFEFSALGLDDYLNRLMEESELYAQQPQAFRVHCEAYIENFIDVKNLFDEVEIKLALERHLLELEEKLVDVSSKLDSVQLTARHELESIGNKLAAREADAKRLSDLTASQSLMMAKLSEQQEMRIKEIDRLKKDLALSNQQCASANEKHQSISRLQQEFAAREDSLRQEVVILKGLLRSAKIEREEPADLSKAGAAPTMPTASTISLPAKPPEPAPTPKVAAPPPPPPPPPSGKGMPLPPGAQKSKEPIPGSKVREKKPVKRAAKLPNILVQLLKPKDCKGTLFAGMLEEDDYLYKIYELEAYEMEFKLSVATAISVEKGSPKLRKEEVPSVLDPKFLQQVMILRSRLMLSTTSIVEILNRFTAENDDIEKLAVLQKLKMDDASFKPLRDLAASGRPTEQWNDVDRFLYTLHSIDRFDVRIRVIRGMASFEGTYAGVAPNIQYALNASLSLKESIKVRKLFEIILAFINFSISGRRGPVYGFKLSTLEQLSRVLSPSTRRSLVEFIASVIKSKYPDMINWDEDIRGLESAGKVTMESLTNDMNEFQQNFDEIRRELTRLNDAIEKKKVPTLVKVADLRTSECMDDMTEARSVLENFVQANASKEKTLRFEYNEAVSAFAECVAFFGEFDQEKVIQPTEFFGHFSRFRADWKKALNEMENREKKMKMEAEKQQTQSKENQTDSEVKKTDTKKLPAESSRPKGKGEVGGLGPRRNLVGSKKKPVSFPKAGEHGSEELNLDDLLDMMKDVGYEAGRQPTGRAARF